MRSIILLTFVVFGGFVAGTHADQLPATNAAIAAAMTNANAGVVMNRQSYPVIPSMQDAVDSWAKGGKTNGFACGIEFGPTIRKGSPICCIFAINTTTNDAFGYLRLPIEAMSKIELFDSQGKPVAKTTAGKRFSYWTQGQIKDWFDEMNRRRWGRRIFRIRAMFYEQISGELSLPQAFQVKKPGEYTFHLSVRLVKSEQDKDGNFLTTLLPEVTAKVQIRAEDIAPTNSISQVQTNSLPK